MHKFYFKSANKRKFLNELLESSHPSINIFQFRIFFYSENVQVHFKYHETFKFNWTTLRSAALSLEKYHFRPLLCNWIYERNAASVYGPLKTNPSVKQIAGLFCTWRHGSHVNGEQKKVPFLDLSLLWELNSIFM